MEPSDVFNYKVHVCGNALWKKNTHFEKKKFKVGYMEGYKYKYVYANWNDAAWIDKEKYRHAGIIVTYANNN